MGIMNYRFKRDIKYGEQDNNCILFFFRTVRVGVVAVVIAFFFCWAPFHTQRLLSMYVNNQKNVPEPPKEFGKINEVLYYLSGEPLFSQLFECTDDVQYRT